MCDVCKELTQNKDTVKIHELYENTSGYFYPENEMIIKYCPCCGKELNAERKSATSMLEELQAKMLSIAEDFDSWLEEMAEKNNMPKDEIQALIRQFLQ